MAAGVISISIIFIVIKLSTNHSTKLTLIQLTYISTVVKYRKVKLTKK